MSLKATFPNIREAEAARRSLSDRGMPAKNLTLVVAAPGLVEETSLEGQVMGRIVAIIVLASIVGTAIGAGLGVALHLTVGPEGTSGLIIQVVSWAIFAHLLIGMWAGYLLLADRSEREIGRARPVILTVRCANIDADALVERLRALGATQIDAL